MEWCRNVENIFPLKEVDMQIGNLVVLCYYKWHKIF